jgi:hypothetical protein
MILRNIVLAMSLAATGAAQAAAQRADGAADSPALTGSPSNATATVSPTTIAQALSRQDDSGSGNDVSFGLSYGTSIASGDFGTSQGRSLISASAAAA